MSGGIPSLTLATAPMGAPIATPARGSLPVSTAGASTPADPKLVKVAQQFEALFVRQMLTAAHKANFGDNLFSSQASDTFRDMQDQKFADLAAQKGSFGMARMIERQVSHQARISVPGSASASTAPAAAGKTGG